MLVGSTGTLVAVTLDAGGGNASPLDMNSNTSLVYVSRGLTLSGVTVFLGNTSGTTVGRLAVSGGAETIDGTPGHPGTITLGDSPSNGLDYSGLTGLLTLVQPDHQRHRRHDHARALRLRQPSHDRGRSHPPRHQSGHDHPRRHQLDQRRLHHSRTRRQPPSHRHHLQLTRRSCLDQRRRRYHHHQRRRITLDAGGEPTTADNSAWLNLGTIASNASTVALGGTFTFAALYTYNRTAGAVDLTGTLNNKGTTLLLNSTTGSWNLQQGTVQGGTIEAPGFALMGGIGTLNGVVLDAGGGNTSPLDTSSNDSATFVSGGLTLSGVTIFLGQRERHHDWPARPQRRDRDHRRGRRTPWNDHLRVPVLR